MHLRLTAFFRQNERGGRYFSFIAPLNVPYDRPPIEAASPPATAFRHRMLTHSASGHSPSGKSLRSCRRNTSLRLNARAAPQDDTVCATAIPSYSHHTSSLPSRGLDIAASARRGRVDISEAFGNLREESIFPPPRP